MKLDIFAKNIELDNPLRVFVEQKMMDLERLLGQDNSEIMARVEIGRPSKHHKSGPVFYAEANLTVGGKFLRGQAEHVDLRAAIVEVKEELRIQINKLKEKRKAQKRTRI
ncbi:MAG TPA: ribosome-associated translation inhibitor RaiA [Candidatus Paceibacterota bacterium]|nr:ribosome-associated translation inhibitor RaiA [Candidatus Paceibacterota bacterium]